MTKKSDLSDEEKKAIRNAKAKQKYQENKKDPELWAKQQERTKNYNENNVEAIKTRRKSRIAALTPEEDAERREKNRNRAAKRQEENKEEHLAKNRLRYHANKDKHKIRVEKSNRKLRTDVLDAYGNRCECCGTTFEQWLTIDHINGNGNKHREEVGSGYHFYRWLRNNNYPKAEFRILCYNCNCSRGHHKYCPCEKRNNPEFREQELKQQIADCVKRMYGLN